MWVQDQAVWSCVFKSEQWISVFMSAWLQASWSTQMYRYDAVISGLYSCIGVLVFVWYKDPYQTMPHSNKTNFGNEFGTTEIQLLCELKFWI